MSNALELIRENVPLGPLTYYKIGGPARYFSQPENLADLARLSAFIQEKKVGFFVLGAGSNILFDDRGFDGLVLHTAKLDRSLTQTADEIEAGASVMNAQLLRQCMNTGLSGFEFLAGVPGNLGGALFMNAGAKLGEMGNVVQSVTLFDLKTGGARTLQRNEMDYAYRSQTFVKTGQIIVRAKLRGAPSEPKVVQERIQALLDNRKKSQPIDKPSCGSVFKNPSSERQAWKLIEGAGLRGHRHGNAQISPVHCNFIVNLGQATAGDVMTLIAEAKKRVQARFGIVLEEEVRIVPFNSAAAD